LGLFFKKQSIGGVTHSVWGRLLIFSTIFYSLKRNNTTVRKISLMGR